ncbi:MAG: hypothetical protein AB1696_02560 [Planctomycetota bacterium]
MEKKLKALEEFDSSCYEAIDLDRLVIYTAVELEKVGVTLFLENIVVAAFRLFPKKFSLPGYPEYPDSARVEKSLWRSRGKRRRWIGGKTPHGYLITDVTKLVAAQTAEELSGVSAPKPTIASRLRRREAILREVTNSPAYQKYVDGRVEMISRSDFCYLLQGTLDSSKDTLRDNLLSLKEFARELGRMDLLKFLDGLEDRFKDFLGNK